MKNNIDDGIKQYTDTIPIATIDDISAIMGEDVFIFIAHHFCLLKTP